MILVKAQADVSNRVEKASMISENTQCHHEQNGNRNMNSKGPSSVVTDGNEENVIAQWRKDIFVQKRQRTWVDCVLEFCRKNLKVINLDIWLRRYLSQV